MPRGPRVDAAGAVHHVMIRGVGRRDIFLDDRDRHDLLQRLNRILPEADCACFAWALMPNHVHLVLRTSHVVIGTVMSRIGTGYAMHFNRRYERAGHLFQNRFLSRLVHDDRDLLTLVRYVHLNPVKAGIAPLHQLAGYPWCGHAALMGTRAPERFHRVSEVLQAIDADPEVSRRQLEELMVADLASDPGRIPEPCEAAGDPERLSSLFMDVCRTVCRRAGVPVETLRNGSRVRAVVAVRREVARIGRSRLRLRAADMAPLLGVSRSAVQKLLEEKGSPGGRKQLPRTPYARNVP